MTIKHKSPTFHNICQSIKNDLSHICKKLVSSNPKRVYKIFKLQLTASLFQHFLAKKSNIVKRAGSWTISCGLYLEPVMIWLVLLPDNFQLTVTESIWTALSSFFLSPLYFLPTNSHITMKLSSHSLVSETTYEYNSPPKISHLIIYSSVCRLLILSLEKFSSQFQLTV